MNDNDYMDVHFPDHDHLRKFPDDAYPVNQQRRSCIRIPSFGIRMPVFLAGLLIGAIIALLLVLYGCGAAATDERNTPQARSLRAKVFHQQHSGIAEATRNFDVKTPPAKEKGVAK